MLEYGAKLRTCRWNKEGVADALIEVMVHLFEWRAAGFSWCQVEDLLLIVLYREEKVARVGRSCAAASMGDCWMLLLTVWKSCYGWNAGVSRKELDEMLVMPLLPWLVVLEEE